jgi:L-aminopeptidase/D-esterase-like protein
VKGILVGHSTIISGKGELIVGKGPIRTGVTAILPRGEVFEPVFAGSYCLNGNGEMTGSIWIEESGFLEGPIMITNTHSIGVVHDAVIEWIQRKKLIDKSFSDISWSLPVIAETWDGRLNDINGFHVKRKHVYEAIEKASTGNVVEGNVGGGTGMICHQFKGGIGTSSRIVRIMQKEYTIGVLVQANYGSRELLTIAGTLVGKEISDLMPLINEKTPGTGSSIIVVVATNAPLLPHQLKRMARRVPIGIARVGGISSNGSGDIFIAFSTGNKGTFNRKEISQLKMLPNDSMSDLFLATIQATEEAIINAMIAAKTMTGINNNTVYALPHDRLIDILQKYNRIDF